MDNEFNFPFYKLLGDVLRGHFSLSHKTLEKEGLYPGQPPVLFTIYKNDGISQKEIAEKTKIKPATVTVMIRRLEKAGFVSKSIDSNDQRISRIHLTEKGLNACTNLKKVISEIDSICLNNFTKDEINSLQYLLNKVKNNLKENKTELS
ncbi:MarR family winged helix-turn-helix transcriptional regulator [Clostridium sp.]|uniref:MarR family winged helix-turn-helix transcriptional regulator n=1 Tax=Clostridium sp. TaxID=1506 RepID=UPI0026DDC4D0|nr:MarR family transcriptional regulator [Clostridium sp.]MDO5039997.1 MarR family transcriptional regulator [Clostridium sp.]